MNKHIESYIKLVESKFFTIGMLIQHIRKYHNNQDKIEILITKLYSFNDQEIIQYLHILVFSAILYDIKNFDYFFITKIRESVQYFQLIYSAFELWGYQFINNPNKMKRMTIFLEISETSFVNGNDMNRAQSKFSQLSIDNQIEQIHIISETKKVKNNFKDQVREFLTFLVRLSYYLIKIDRSLVRDTAKKYLIKLNNDLIRRRENSSTNM